MLISAKHQIIGVPYRQDLATLFPHAKQANGLLLLPHSLDETLVLRNLGIDAPAPVLHQYNWAGGVPFEVQRKTAAMLTTNRRAYVLNGMGTGKTKAALWSADYLKGKGLMKRVLVTAPLSTLNFTWAREIFQTIPHRSCAILHGTKAKRLDLLAQPHDFYIVNHDGLAVIYNEILERGDIDAFIIDELAVFRNGGSDRSKLARRLAGTREWVWGMTGAPTPNEPTDVWAQTKIITPERTTKYFTHFKEALMMRVSQYKWVPKADATERAFACMQPAVRFTLDDIMELPELVQRTADVALGPKQAKVYATMKATAVALIAMQEVTAVNAGALLNKLLQISAGWVYDSKGVAAMLDNTPRLDALVDAINATDRKVLVFAPYKHVIAGISEHLNKKNINIEHAVITGNTPQKQRAEIFTAFQNSSKYKAIIAHPNTMAHGITLTAADTIIWFSPITSLEIFDQANARIRRVGQKHRQQILMFAGTPIERKVYSTLRSKQSIQERLLQMFEDNNDEGVN